MIDGLDGLFVRWIAAGPYAARHGHIQGPATAPWTRPEYDGTSWHELVKRGWLEKELLEVLLLDGRRHDVSPQHLVLEVEPPAMVRAELEEWLAS